jgi:beta-glucosidase
MAFLLLVVMATPLYASSAWSNAADPPATRAAAILKQMNLSEKVAMLHGQRGVSHVGHDSNYTGLILGNKRLGIPAIQMEDGPQGFRCGKMPCAPGSSTAWPSGLTIAATWDTALALRWGEAMGAEFRGKGANVQLGPGMCIARVPTNGRNFEYLSGMNVSHVFPLLFTSFA